ncbi:alanine racemase [Parasphingorhabdus cellanae]|uniref:alanine racemase n=1 Tax=Parasphingorhabdus cellanae TaxID=2806553 RepID=A0ABX7T6T6_9SPHN|nr:alanine racemase [Parasphingorhabdus cellanae]QTD57319.1 alanine racemase [Parasphingorhabdus cellanae]
MDKTRRSFLSGVAVCAGGALSTGCATGAALSQSKGAVSDVSNISRLRPGGSINSNDPWIEIDAEAFRNNVREVSRMAGGTPIMAPVKNNAYGLGDIVVGPLLASMPEVSRLACVRVSEGLALRAAGVKKPILNMSEVTEEEIEELVLNGIEITCWLDDAGERLDRVSKRLGKPIPVHFFIDTGLNREGMPYNRALPWMKDLARRSSVKVAGIYTMFIHDIEHDKVQLARFNQLIAEARKENIPLGLIHASPSYTTFYLPEARFDTVRSATALFGLYPDANAVSMADLKYVWRLRARVVRLEQLQPGETVGFGPKYTVEKPTTLALLPVGSTDGYPSSAVNNCKVLIGGHLYPVVGSISSAHTIIDVSEKPDVSVGDVATLVGPDHKEIEPRAVAKQAGIGHYALMSRLNPLLPRKLV